MLQIAVDKAPGKEERHRLAQRLMLELKEINVSSVALAVNEASPESTKSAEGLAVGAVMVAVLPAVLPKLLQCLSDWMARTALKTVRIKREEQGRAIEVEYDLNRISNEEIKSVLTMLEGVIKD